MWSQDADQTTIASRIIRRRRAKLKATINQQIRNLDFFRGRKHIAGEQLVVDRAGAIHFRLWYGRKA